jgi:hypothetical protein
MGPAAHPNSTQLTQAVFSSLTVNAALPAHIVVHDRRSVAITSNVLANFLKALYEVGLRDVVVVIEAAGQRIAIEASIYRKFDRRRGRVFHLLYPRQPAQSLLRDMLGKWRNSASPDAKRPMPIMIYSLTPKLK